MKTNLAMLAIGAAMVSAAAMATSVAIATKIRLNQHFLQHLFAHLNEELFDSYRPEKHYMRGPGPKWRQKHGHVNGTKKWLTGAYLQGEHNCGELDRA